MKNIVLVALSVAAINVSATPLKGQAKEAYIGSFVSSCVAKESQPGGLGDSVLPKTLESYCNCIASLSAETITYEDALHEDRTGDTAPITKKVDQATITCGKKLASILRDLSR